MPPSMNLKELNPSLMEPPAGPADRLPVVAYNLGGIVANSLLALAAAGVACAAGPGISA